MFGSDIAHWDVPDMAEVLEEAWEMVEHGWINEARLPRLHVHQPGALLHARPTRGSSTAPWSRRAVDRLSCSAEEWRMLDLAGPRGRASSTAPAHRARPADVGVRDGRIVAVGTVDEAAARTIDADGLVVRPASSTSTRTTTRRCCGTRRSPRRRCTASPR